MTFSHLLKSGCAGLALFCLATLNAQTIKPGQVVDNQTTRTTSFDFSVSASLTPLPVKSVAVEYSSSGEIKDSSAVPAAAAVPPAAKAVFLPWKDLRQSSAYLFLVEVSDATGDDEVIKEGGVFSAKETRKVNRNATVAAFAKMLSEAARTRQNPQFGLYTFSNTLTRSVALGGSPIDFYNQTVALGTLDTDKNSREAMLYRSALDALKDLAAVQAERRTLVVLASGRSNDVAPNNSSAVVQFAKDKGIAIHAIGLSEAPAEESFQQFLQLLAEATGGLYQRVAKTEAGIIAPASLLTPVFNATESGGHVDITFPAQLEGKVGYDVVFTLGDGSTSRLSRTVALPILNPDKKLGTDIAIAEDAAFGLPELRITSDPLVLSSATDTTRNTHVFSFRFPEPRATDSVELETVSSALDQPKLTYTPWADSGERAAYYFLLDTSSATPKDKADPSLPIFRKLISRLLDENPRNREFGLATVGATLSEIAPVGNISVKRLSEELDRLELPAQRDPRCRLFQAASSAIRSLSESKAQRRVLVILASGRTEEVNDTYSLGSVTKLAQEKGVMIQTIGFNQENASMLQILRSLSEAGPGGHADVRFDEATRKALLPRDFFSSFYKRAENGGRVLVEFSAKATGAQQLKLRFRQEGGRTIPVIRDVTLATPAASQVPGKDEKGAPVASGASASKPADFWARNGDWIMIAGGSVLVLTVLCVVLMLRLRATAAPAPQPIVLSDLPPPPDFSQFKSTDAGEVFAWLEMVDASRTRHEMRRPALRIGRSSSNDVSFPNDSVSGFHAEILMSRDRRFTITDLDSSNGTFVNGRRVESSALNNNDVVELGEAKFRVVLNT